MYNLKTNTLKQIKAGLPQSIVLRSIECLLLYTYSTPATFTPETILLARFTEEMVKLSRGENFKEIAN